MTIYYYHQHDKELQSISTHPYSSRTAVEPAFVLGAGVETVTLQIR
jgi:hypothetical protein